MKFITFLFTFLLIFALVIGIIMQSVSIGEIKVESNQLYVCNVQICFVNPVVRT